MAKYRTNLILGKTRMENGFTTRSQKDVEEDVESVRRGNLGDTQLLLANQQPAGSSLFCVVPEGRARLEGFSDREADCRERAVPRMCPKGFRVLSCVVQCYLIGRRTLSAKCGTSGMEAGLSSP